MCSEYERQQSITQRAGLDQPTLKWVDVGGGRVGKESAGGGETEGS